MTLNPRQFGDDEAEDVLGAFGGARAAHQMADDELLHHLKTSHSMYGHINSIEHMDEYRRNAHYNGRIPKKFGKNDPVIKHSSRKALEGAHETDHSAFIHSAYIRPGRKRHGHAG